MLSQAYAAHAGGGRSGGAGRIWTLLCCRNCWPVASLCRSRVVSFVSYLSITHSYRARQCCLHPDVLQLQLCGRLSDHSAKATPNRLRVLGKIVRNRSQLDFLTFNKTFTKNLFWFRKVEGQGWGYLWNLQIFVAVVAMLRNANLETWKRTCCSSPTPIRSRKSCTAWTVVGVRSVFVLNMAIETTFSPLSYQAQNLFGVT